jgi:glycine cleavage system H protein
VPLCFLYFRKGETIMGNWKILEDCKYTKSDEWIRVEGAEGVVGITDYAQDQLSDLVFVELPQAGSKLEAGAILGVVESVKAAADLKLPASGEVVAANEALESNPEVINSDPYGAGWIARIKLSNPAELDSLMTADAYKAYCEERE